MSTAGTSDFGTTAFGALSAPPATAHLRKRALTVGAVATAAVAIGAVTNPEQFFRSYLVAYLLWFSVAIGALALIMLNHLTGGAWGLVSRRLLEAAARTMPALTLLFIPILIGMRSLYSWTDAELVTRDEILQHKRIYLNAGAFIFRTIIYFGIWNAFAFLLNRWSLEQDQTGDPALWRRMRRACGAGLGIHVLTTTFAAFDWMMSLDPHWFSSIYGVYFLGAHGLAILSILIMTAAWLVKRPPMNRFIKATHFSDWGNLMLAFVLLWAYFSLSQYLIIWSGNLPEEIVWYLQRLDGGWQSVAVGLVLLHFLVPFLVLLSRFVKYNLRLLTSVAVLVFVMRWVDFHWQVAPTFSDTLSLHWLDVATPVALGGIWIGLWFAELPRRPLLPVGDPALKEALKHELA